MNISKLTITPLESNVPHIDIIKPNPERAGLLIKEKLASRTNLYNNKMERIYRKIPKCLQGFVDPQTKVAENTRFRADV